MAGTANQKGARLRSAPLLDPWISSDHFLLGGDQVTAPISMHALVPYVYPTKPEAGSEGDRHWLWFNPCALLYWANVSNRQVADSLASGGWRVQFLCSLNNASPVPVLSVRIPLDTRLHPSP